MRIVVTQSSMHAPFSLIPMLYTSVSFLCYILQSHSYVIYFSLIPMLYTSVSFLCYISLSILVTPPRCSSIYNMYYSVDPLAARLEPILDQLFSLIPPVTIPSYGKYPTGMSIYRHDCTLVTV